MRGIGTGHGAVETVLGAVRVDPTPHRRSVIAVGACHIDSLTMAIPAGAPFSPVQRIAGAGMQPGGDALTIIVAKRAEQGPADPGGIHGAAGMVELLTKIRVHSADRTHSGMDMPITFGGGRIFPS